MSEPDNATKANRFAALVDQWHFEAFNGSIVARDVEIWNLVRAATEDLKRRLVAMVSTDAP